MRVAAALSEHQRGAPSPDIEARLSFAHDQACLQRAVHAAAPAAAPALIGSASATRPCSAVDPIRRHAVVAAARLLAAAGLAAGRPDADRQPLHALADRCRSGSRRGDPGRRPAARGLPRPGLRRVPQDGPTVTVESIDATQLSCRSVCARLRCGHAWLRAARAFGQALPATGPIAWANLSPAQRSVLTPLRVGLEDHQSGATAKVGRSRQSIPHLAVRRPRPAPAAALPSGHA